MCNSSIQLGTSCLKEEKVKGETISKNQPKRVGQSRRLEGDIRSL